MRIETTGTAIIQSAETGESFEIQADELEWDSVSADERQMGTAVEYAAIVEHPVLGELSWHIWEYPSGAENYRDTRVGENHLIENFSIIFMHEPDGEDYDHRNDREYLNKRGKLYYSNDDSEGVFADQLKKMRPEEQIPYLTHWFLGQFQDPAQETPYNSREGGYQYIHGGPYDANDEISGEFDGIASETSIDGAVQEVEEDGIYDWAPIDPPYDDPSGHWSPLDAAEEFEQTLLQTERLLEAGALPQLGSREEIELRRRINAAFEQLENELPPAQAMHGGAGHNNPPFDERFTAQDLREIREATETVRDEINKDRPLIGPVGPKLGFWPTRRTLWEHSLRD